VLTFLSKLTLYMYTGASGMNSESSEEESSEVHHPSFTQHQVFCSVIAVYS